MLCSSRKSCFRAISRSWFCVCKSYVRGWWLVRESACILQLWVYSDGLVLALCWFICLCCVETMVGWCRHRVWGRGKEEKWRAEGGKWLWVFNSRQYWVGDSLRAGENILWYWGRNEKARFNMFLFWTVSSRRPLVVLALKKDSDTVSCVEQIGAHNKIMTQHILNLKARFLASFRQANWSPACWALLYLMYWSRLETLTQCVTKCKTSARSMHLIQQVTKTVSYFLLFVKNMAAFFPTTLLYKNKFCISNNSHSFATIKLSLRLILQGIKLAWGWAWAWVYIFLHFLLFSSQSELPDILSHSQHSALALYPASVVPSLFFTQVLELLLIY